MSIPPSLNQLSSFVPLFSIDDYGKDRGPGEDFYVAFTMILCSLLCLVSCEANIHRLATNGFTVYLSSI